MAEGLGEDVRLDTGAAKGAGGTQGGWGPGHIRSWHRAAGASSEGLIARVRRPAGGASRLEVASWWASRCMVSSAALPSRPGRQPCPHVVDCFVSRPEKTVFFL